MADPSSPLTLETFLEQLPRIQPGWVWLAGSGPGDVGLVTAHLMVGLFSADVVVHDALVSDEVLRLVPQTAKLHYAGKRGGKPSVMQADITEVLINHAKEGKRVLRLKGGDSMLFGRGAEEATHLAKQGVPFRILPGVTSGIAAPSYAGIPLTHRALSSSVSFITGHGASGGVPNMNWSALAQGADVLVFFMGMKHAGLIQQKLLQAGVPETRACAIISNATLREQQVSQGVLRDLSQLAENMSSPAIIVIGETVPLSSQLAWFGDAEPLAGP